ncbi:MAG: amidohydrolase family protein [Halobacteria archaeon]
MGLVDVHFHFIAVPEYLAVYRQHLETLDRAVLLVFSSPGLKYREIQHMVPNMAKSFVGNHFKALAKNAGEEAEAFADRAGTYDLAGSFARWWRGAGMDRKTIPFIDDRDFRTLDERRLEAYRKQGFAGIKTFYIPDYDDAGMKGYPEVLGMGRDEYRASVRRLFDFAAARDMPVLCHVDLRRNSDLMKEVLDAHPNLHLDIPHFGYARPLMGPMLEKYENLYSDVSSLMPVMKEKTASYMEFIEKHREKILLGTEGLPVSAGEFVKFFEKHLKPETVEMVARGNAERWLEKVW